MCLSCLLRPLITWASILSNTCAFYIKNRKSLCFVSHLVTMEKYFPLLFIYWIYWKQATPGAFSRWRAGGTQNGLANWKTMITGGLVAKQIPWFNCWIFVLNGCVVPMETKLEQRVSAQVVRVCYGVMRQNTLHGRMNNLRWHHWNRDDGMDKDRDHGENTAAHYFFFISSKLYRQMGVSSKV